MLAAAVGRLEAIDPSASARSGLWPGQLRFLLVLGAAFGVLLLAAPGTLVSGLDALFAAVFASLLAVRLVALCHLLTSRRAADLATTHYADALSRNAHSPDAHSSDAVGCDTRLPTYTVLIALYREVAVVPQVVQAMRGLDYPVARLEVVFILEADDVDTHSALLQTGLPPHMRIVVVPAGLPRTKPRALSFALTEACGTYVVVYDAEDIPDPDQLRRAAARFRAEGPILGCLQARLVIDNGQQSWLTGQFAVEYLVLFQAILPALARFGLPVPLGGTSNHFPKATLDAVGGWDPYNVTEDADLGYRLGRAGYRVAMLDSATAEEAPSRWPVWLAQRARWQKGWMQTYLVHMRDPRRLVRDFGWPGMVAFQLVLGCGLLSAFAHPWFFAWMVYRATRADEAAAVPGLLGPATLAAASLVAISLAVAVVWRCGQRGLLMHAVLSPLYWLPISFAAYRALAELVRAPFYWAKTQHGDGVRRRPSA